jgi:hypothetical protein
MWQQRKRDSLLGFLRTESFLEKTVLLLLTAILSGLIVPLVIKLTDEARADRAAVSTAQAKLFEDVSDVILTFETLALDVSWFGTKVAKNPEMQKRAFERYNERVVDLVVRWRVQASRAQTLASKPVATKIENMLIEVFNKQDTPTVALWSKCGVDCNWQEQHQENERMLVRANALIAELAKDLRLVKP